MPCPFLREGRASYCHAAAGRKLILAGPGAATGGGRCTSGAHRECGLVRDGDSAGAGRCPHLEEIHVQYCGAAPVTKLVPFSESQSSRCHGESYSYCDLYLAMARPHHLRQAAPGLYFSSNHMWLDVSREGACHIGIDAFLTATAGEIDGITFVAAKGTARPSVVLTLKGVEWPMVFPNPMIITEVNSQARHDPSRLQTDPYGGGWLFEGWELPGRTREGLMRGPQAAAWADQETERLARFVHERFGLAADGGHAAPGIVQFMPRDSVVQLLQEFFGPQAGWGKDNE